MTVSKAYFQKSSLLVSMTQHTVESRFYEPPRETKIVSKNRRVRELGGKITCTSVQCSRNDFWFEFIGRFEKLRVREIGIPL